MKILLIASNTAESPYPVYPLGMSVIAGALKKDKHDVMQYDFLHNDQNLESVQDVVRTFCPGLIGISIRNIDNVNLLGEKRYLDAVKDIISSIKKVCNTKIVLGGAGFSLIPEAILLMTGGDYGIVGEGEKSVRELAALLESGSLPTEKLIYSDIDKTSYISGAHYSEEIMKFYLQYGNIAPIQTKRGCPEKCIYCSYPLLEGESLRGRDPENVVDEIVLVVEKLGAKMIFFTDSVFNDQDGHYLDVLNEMKKRKIKIPWTAFFKPGALNESVVTLMKDTGLEAAEIGADAATDETLKKMGKKFNFTEIASCSKLFKKHGIPSAIYYMMGGPGETEETVLKGINNIKSIKDAASFVFMGIRILPKTPLERIALKHNIIDEKNDLVDSSYYLSPLLRKEWLETTLTEAFKNEPNCLFPPDSLDDKLKMLHRLGYTGLLLDKFLAMSAKER